MSNARKTHCEELLDDHIRDKREIAAVLGVPPEHHRIMSAIRDAPHRNSDNAPHRNSADAPHPWRPIDELGTVSVSTDGTTRWTLNPGYEEHRMFAVYMRSGEVGEYYASIDDGGMLVDQYGDDMGHRWSDATYFMDIPKIPE